MKNLAWGRNVEVNAPAMKSHKDSNEVLLLRLARAPTITHKNQEPHTITHNSHNDEKIALVLFLASGFAIWNMFQ